MFACPQSTFSQYIPSDETCTHFITLYSIQTLDVLVPSTLPVFSTIPKRIIHLVDGESGVMACSIQRRTDFYGPGIEDDEGNTILMDSFLFDDRYDYIDELNLVINTSTVEVFYRLDFYCNLTIEETNLAHQTTFLWHRKFIN